MGKISTNTNLKRRIREFQSQHGVSHSTALRAVDEPLHRLRDLSRLPREASLSGIQDAHFRIVGNQGPFSYPVDVPISDIALTGSTPNSEEERWVNKSSSGPEIMAEISRRFTILSRTGTEDIWSYREHFRAGLLAGSALTLQRTDSPEELEPWFVFFGVSDRIQRYLGQGEGARLGIFPVDRASIIEGNGRRGTIPVTFQELRGLREGTIEGEPRFLPRINRRPGLIVEEKTYSLMAALRDDWGTVRPRVLFGDPAETVESARERLRSLGVEPERFELMDISRERLKLELGGDWLMLSGSKGFSRIETISGVTIELDGDLALARSVELRAQGEGRSPESLEALETQAMLQRTLRE